MQDHEEQAGQTRPEGSAGHAELSEARVHGQQCREQEQRDTDRRAHLPDPVDVLCEGSGRRRSSALRTGRGLSETSSHECHVKAGGGYGGGP
ncbi:hypothetical protein GCM10017778_08350 [Streptomyces vinaceus]|nr:hypothetical protein GCM10017778_08350 [Streptomyces vinaceus]